MNNINQYMIPLDSIQSTRAADLILEIILALRIGLLAAVVIAAASVFPDKSVLTVAAAVGIITAVLACYWMVQSGGTKSIGTSKINDEYGITVTSMDHDGTKQDGIESHRLSYLHDGAIINGTLIIKDNKVGLFAGTGDKLTPVKPAAAHSAALVNRQR